MAKSTDSINIKEATKFVDEISFSLKHLDFNSWGFDKLRGPTNGKELNRFLKKYSGKSVNFFNKYVEPCINDKQDTFMGQQINHYKVTDKFRIHGFFIGNRFKIIRIDPNHKVHK